MNEQFPFKRTADGYERDLNMRHFLDLFRKRTWRNDPQLWRKHVAEIQAELDAERLKGYGYRADNGRRIDF